MEEKKIRLVSHTVLIPENFYGIGPVPARKVTVRTSCVTFGNVLLAPATGNFLVPGCLKCKNECREACLVTSNPAIDPAPEKSGKSHKLGLDEFSRIVELAVEGKSIKEITAIMMEEGMPCNSAKKQAIAVSCNLGALNGKSRDPQGKISRVANWIKNGGEKPSDCGNYLFNDIQKVWIIVKPVQEVKVEEVEEVKPVEKKKAGKKEKAGKKDAK